MSHRALDVWKLAREVSIEVHRMTLKSLPRFELHEAASQIRRAAKAVRSNIVEGCGRRRYKAEFVRFLVDAQASRDETTDHRETPWETGSLKDNESFERLHALLQVLGSKLNLCIQTVEKNPRSKK